ESEVHGDIRIPTVRATDDPASLGTVDLVILSVKLWDTEPAIRQIKPLIKPGTGVLSLQNGVIKDDILRRELGDAPVMGGVCYVGTTIARPGVILQTGAMQRVVIGEYDGRTSERARFLHEALVKASVTAELSKDVPRAIWEKYVFLVGLSATTAAMRTTIGPIRKNPRTRAFLLEIMREVVAVGRAARPLLIDLETEEGVTGRSYLFCYLNAVARAIATVLGEVEHSVKGDRAVPADLWAKLARRFKLIGVQGIVRMAMSGFDLACWDALALAAGKPLVTLLGGVPRRIRAYNSNGLGLMSPEAAADEAEKLLEGGFRAVKLRLGHPTLAADLAAVRAVRKRIPDSVELMVDFNQALSLAASLERGRAIDSEGIAWIEEPIRHDDFRACAELARALTTPVQIGENFSLPEQMTEALAAGA